MLPDLVKFHDEYNEEKMTVVSLNLGKNKSGANGFPVTAIPTQFIFDADGSPYRPKNFATGSSFELITDDVGEHTLTKHIGSLFYDDMVTIYEDIIGQ